MIVIELLGRLPCELYKPLSMPVPADQLHFAFLWWNEKQSRIRQQQKYLEWKAQQHG